MHIKTQHSNGPCAPDMSDKGCVSQFVFTTWYLPLSPELWKSASYTKIPEKNRNSGVF